MGTTSQQFCLKWNNHSSNMLNVFETLLTSEQLVDVTLACDGLSLKAHKMVLSACSPFFQSLFQENPCKHPIVILKDIRYADLKAIIDFMYKGEVNVGQAHLSALLKTAETLKVKGLAEVSGEDGQSSSGSVVQQEVPVYPQAQHSSDVANIVQTIDSSVRPSSDSPTGRKRKRTKWKNRGGQGGGGGNDSETDDQGPAAKNQEIVSADVIEDDSSSIGVVDGPSDTRNAKDSRIIIEEATIVGDYVEPAALMEQNMTTDNVQPVSSQLMLTNATSKDNNINVPESRSYDTTVATMNPETVDLVDRPEDVKPTALVSYEEPPMSPNATSSHHSQDDSNSMTMYMDPNSMPAIAGPSNYQQDKQPSASAGQDKQCQYCGLFFNSALNRLRHERNLHLTDWSVKCKKCKVTFTQKDVYLAHNVNEHNYKFRQRQIQTDLKFKCKYCSMSYTTRSGRAYHHLMRHSDESSTLEKPDVDKEKPKEFNYIVVGGERRYPCQYCDKIYSNKSNRRSHIKHLHANDHNRDASKDKDRGDNDNNELLENQLSEREVIGEDQILHSQEVVIQLDEGDKVGPSNSTKSDNITSNGVSTASGELNVVSSSQKKPSTPRMKYFCNECPLSYIDRSSLFRHKRKKHKQ